ncbi:hypothetical protein [Neptunomonas phycophila]|uniref:hypothetical protein n=1 Tax=Neptunomonas phycophila TaxID=1572645 RepID=UPI003513E85E
MKITRASVKILFGLCSASALAAPIESDHLISIFQLDFPDAYSESSTDSYFQNTYATGVTAYGDLTTGKVGSSSIGADSINSIVSIYDTLTFDTSTDVGFSFNIDGLLASNSIFESPYGQARFDIFDITGLANWLEEDYFFGIPDVTVSDDAVSVSANTISLRMDGANAYQTGVGDYTVEYDLPRDGEFHEVAYDLNGVFSVDSTKKYGIRLAANTFSSVGTSSTSAADFSNTGTFAFTNLGGASFTSGSGAFLSASPTASVPTPSALSLLCLGLLGIGVIRRTKKA